MLHLKLLEKQEQVKSKNKQKERNNKNKGWNQWYRDKKIPYKESIEKKLILLGTNGSRL
jgi:hypothetical protein